MNLKLQFSYFLIVLVWTICCEPKTESKNPNDVKGTCVVGQWYTDNKAYPHWIEFDSNNHYFRWSFDEEKPAEPTATFKLIDSVIIFDYPEDYKSAYFIDSIEQNALTILPMVGTKPTFFYQRDTFIRPQFADIYIFYLKESEVDSIMEIGIDEAKEQKELNYNNLQEIFYELEYSFAKGYHVNSTHVITRDSSVYNKFKFGGYGVIYSRNDSTYIRRGIPNRKEFHEEIRSFFPYK